MCAELQRAGYATAWDVLELTPWVSATSDRVWIWCVDTAPLPEDGSRIIPTVVLQGLPSKVKALAKEVQAQRRASPGCPVSHHLLHPSSPGWLHHIIPSHTTRSIGCGRAADAEETSWFEQAATVRRKWGRAGFMGADSHAWTEPPSGPAPLLRGLPQPVTPRIKEVVNLGFLWSCRQRGLSPLDSAARAAAAKDLIIDVSQNPSRSAWSHGLRRVCRKSAFYSYESDRKLVPYEALRIYGWSNPSLHGVSSSDAWDLIGETMALQTLAVAALSLVFTVGAHVDGLWA